MQYYFYFGLGCNKERNEKINEPSTGLMKDLEQGANERVKDRDQVEPETNKNLRTIKKQTEV